MSAPRATSPPGSASAALIELIEPYRGAADALDAYRTLVTIGAVAWNLSLFPEGEREEHLAEAARELDLPERDVTREMVRALTVRKEQLFPQDRRMIVNFEVTETATGYHVMVASAGVSDA